MGTKFFRKATLWLLVLFVVFCFAPFSSSADDGGAERNVTSTVQAAKKAVSNEIGDVEPAPVVKSSFVCKFNSCIIVLLNLSTMLRAQIAALWQFALALLLCQFPLIF